MTEPVLIDGHVHIYPDFDLSTFLDAASRNFPGRRGCLLLTETARDDAFAALRDAQGLPAGWQVQTFADDPAAVVSRYVPFLKKDGVIALSMYSPKKPDSGANKLIKSLWEATDNEAKWDVLDDYRLVSDKKGVTWRMRLVKPVV